MIFIKNTMIKELENGIRIMNLEARYLYSSRDNENGYETQKFWETDTKKKKIPLKLYSVKMSYSLGTEKLYELAQNEFMYDDYGVLYTDAIINVSFSNSAKKESENQEKNKYIIKSSSRGRNLTSQMQKVPRLKVEMNTKELRKYLYENGCVLNGNKYLCFMRSTSKSREGNMLFIKEQYLNVMLHEWARLGITFPEDRTIDVAGIKSYESLVLSGIIAKLQLKPEEILLIPDYDSKFIGEASVTRTNEENRLCVANEKIEFCNSIWDGQSLMDFSKFQEIIEHEDVDERHSLKGKSFVLLRNLWFKSAAFNFDMQRYFREHDVTLEDVKKHGWTIASDITDIKLITTPNSLKILKIKEFVDNKYPHEADGQQRSMFEYWLEHIKDNDFGIVKSEHGIADHARRCNPQILMALPLTKDDMRELLNVGEFQYMDLLRNNDYAFLSRIGNQGSNEGKMIYELASYVPGIIQTDLYKDYKNNTLNDLKENWKKEGIKIPNSDYAVCVSNPLEMIQYASGIEPEEWTRVHIGREAYCKFYDEDMELLATRNPCVSSGNIMCLKNTWNEALEYMTLSNNIVVVNSIESDIMDRASGMDFDSDQMWLSSNPLLVEKAKYCEENFLTPVCKIGKEKISKRNTIEDLAETDSTISKGKIGDIVNMGQILQAYYWNIYFSTEIESEKKEQALNLLYDKISLLSSASGAEIDSAKRQVKMNIKKELAELRKLGKGEDTESFILEFLEYGKPENVRKKTITEEELEANPQIKEAVNKVEEYRAKKNLSEKEKQEKKTLEKEISHFLVHDHKKDISKTKDKIRKPLHFKYAFPKSVENSIYFENGMNCPMDNLCVLVDEETPKKKTKDKKTNVMDYVVKNNKRGNDKHITQVKEIAEKYSKFVARQKFISESSEVMSKGVSRKEFFEQCVAEIKDIQLTHATIIVIFNSCYGSNQAKSQNVNNAKMKKHMIDLVYAAHREKVLECFNGIQIYGQRSFMKMHMIPMS